MKTVYNTSTLTHLTADRALEIARRHPVVRERSLGVELAQRGALWVVSTGNGRERDLLAEAIAAADRTAAPTANGRAQATARQRDYLESLARSDYGTATTWGLDRGIPADLSKAEASRLISEFLDVS